MQDYYNSKLDIDDSDGRDYDIELARENGRQFSRAESIAYIDQELSRGHVLSRIEIQKHTCRSRETVKRCITELRDIYDAPIEYSRKQKGYIYTDATYRLPQAITTRTELKATILVKNLLDSLKGTSFYEQASIVFDRLSSVASSGRIGRVGISGSPSFIQSERIIFMSDPLTEIDQTKWDLVYKALEQNCTLRFNYLDDSGKLTPYTVQIIQIIFNSGDWYLWSYIYTSRKTRLFRLGKCQNLTSQKGTGERIELTDKTDFLKVQKGHFGCFSDGKILHYKLFIYKNTIAFHHIQDRQWGENQTVSYDNQGNMILSFDSDQEEIILLWIQSWGCDIEPIEPKEVYEVWRDRLLTLAGRINQIEKIRSGKDYKNGDLYLPLAED